MKATEFIAALNSAAEEANLYIGKEATKMITDENGVRRFINTVPVYASVLDGVAIPEVNAEGRAVYKWVLGKEVNTTK